MLLDGWTAASIYATVVVAVAVVMAASSLSFFAYKIHV